MPGIYIIDLSLQGCYYKVLVVSEEMLRSENRIAGLRAIYALHTCFLNAPLTWHTDGGGHLRAL